MCCKPMKQLMMERSALANDLKEVFHGLKEGDGLDVAVNGWIRLSLPRPFSSAGNASITTTMTRTVTESSASRLAFAPESIQPYHTILLLVDEET